MTSLFINFNDQPWITSHLYTISKLKKTLNVLYYLLRNNMPDFVLPVLFMSNLVTKIANDFEFVLPFYSYE